MNEKRWQPWCWGLITALIGLAVGLGIALGEALRTARSLEVMNHESIYWYSSQLETEFLRLLGATDRYAGGDPAVDEAEIGHRIDILWSRIAIFDNGVPRDRLNAISGARQVVDDLRRALAKVEPGLRALPAASRAVYSPLRGALAASALPLHEMVTRSIFDEDHAVLAELQSLRGNYIRAACLIAALILVGMVLIAFLIVENGVRRRLLEQARTAREREEAALIVSSQRFLAITRANPVAVLVVGRLDGTIRYANATALALLGLPTDGSVDRRMADLFVQRSDMEAIADAGAAGQADQYETRLSHNDGREIPVALSARPLDYDGAPCLVIGILDLTERKTAQAEIERQREMIYQREKLGALGSLLAGVAHELNNPLAVVVAQAAMLEETATDPKTAGRSEKIRRAAARCSSIVKTFLAMARQRPPSRENVDVNRAVEAALELLAYGLRTAGIEVSRELAGALPSIWADPDQISQVLTNLIVNAQQALSDWSGQRRLTVATGFDAATGMARISVADNGPGVPAAIRSRIFEPFFTTKPVGVGTGIGLSVCHGVVASHGGTIAVEDARGGGAAFVVHLPVGSGAEAAAIAAATPPRVAAGTRRVLIVDDEPDIREMLAEILEQDGYRVDVAEGGRTGLERLRTGRYDVVLSDIRMADMDGITLFRQLTELDPDLAKRLIVVTGDTLSGTIRAFLDETNLACLEKPFVPADVRRLVAEAAGRSR